MKHSPTVAVRSHVGGLSVDASSYSWSSSRESGEFSIEDNQGRPVVSGAMQPGIFVLRASDGAVVCSLGEISSVGGEGNVVTFTYDGVNGDGCAVASLEFYADYLVQRPLLYSPPTASNVETVLLSGEWSEGAVVPALRAD